MNSRNNSLRTPLIDNKMVNLPAVARYTYDKLCEYASGQGKRDQFLSLNKFETMQIIENSLKICMSIDYNKTSDIIVLCKNNEQQND